MFSSEVPIKSNCSLYKLIRKDGVIIHNDVPRDFINCKVNIGLKRDLRISSRQLLSRKLRFNSLSQNWRHLFYPTRILNRMKCFFEREYFLRREDMSTNLKLQHPNIIPPSPQHNNKMHFVYWNWWNDNSYV